MEREWSFGRILGDTTLSIYSPSLFSFASSKDVWVADIWEEIEEGGQWSPCFLKEFSQERYERQSSMEGNKGWILLGQNLLLLLGARKRSNLSSKSAIEPLGANESRILCLGSSLGENFCHDPNSGRPKIWPMTPGQRFNPKGSSYSMLAVNQNTLIFFSTHTSQ